jgi:hypothetical protein
MDLYPELLQVVRIYARLAIGVYAAYVAQYADNLLFRDREACYVVEQNSVILRAGYYDCRLVGSYNGLPLFATNCCPTGTFSSGSSG